MIREATIDDITDLVEMGMRFHAGSAYSQLLTPNVEAVTRSLHGLISGDHGIIFVSEADGKLVGAILGILVPHFITGGLACGELSWWVDLEHRGARGVMLLWRLEEWAKERGAGIMSVIEPLQNDGVASIYERLGYRMVEKTWMKAL